MKRLFVILLSLNFIIFFSLTSFAQDKKMEMKKKVEGVDTKVMDAKEDVKKVEKTETKMVDNEPFNSICPVSGEEVDSKITTVYKGKTYALCCKSCLKKFNKYPEKYASKLSEDGKSFKKNTN